jgi:hypothetical protein
MTYPYPHGTLSATEAVSRALLFSDSKSYREAWRDICGLILEGSLLAYVLSGDRSYGADQEQFAALGDLDYVSLRLFRQFESTELESHDDFGFSLFDGRNRHVSGLLFFREKDFDAAWWAGMEPKNLAENIAKWLRKEYGAYRPGLPVASITKAVEREGWRASKRTIEKAIAMAWR